MGAGDYGYWQGLQNATGQALATGMNVLQYKNQQNTNEARLQMEGQRLQMAQDQADQTNKILKIKAAQAEDDAKLIPVDSSLDAIGLKYPEEKAYLKNKVALDIKNIGGLDYIGNAVGKKALYSYMSDPQTNIDIGNIRTSKINEQMAGIDAQLNNPETSGKLKPEQVQQLQQQKQALMQEHAKVANAIDSEDRKLRAKDKESIKNFYNPKTGTWDSYNIVTDDTSGLIPETAYIAQQHDAKAERIADKANAVRLQAAGMRGGSVEKPPKAATTMDVERINKRLTKGDIDGAVAEARTVGLEIEKVPGQPDTRQLTPWGGPSWGGTKDTYRIVDPTKPQGGTAQTNYTSPKTLQGDIDAGKIKRNQTVKVNGVDRTYLGNGQWR